MYLTFIIGPRT